MKRFAQFIGLVAVFILLTSCQPSSPAAPTSTQQEASAPSSLVIFPGKEERGRAISLVSGGDGDTELVQSCQSTELRATGNGRALSADNQIKDSYMQFNVDNAVLFAGKPTSSIQLDIEYCDQGMDIFTVEYDGLSGGSFGDGRFLASQPIAKTDTGLIKTASFVLNDVNFADRDNGADFRISDNGDGAEAIRSVTITLLPAPSRANNGSASPSSTPELNGSAGSRRPVIIDTDMATDDWIAILYLLQRPDIQVIAITVTGTGEAHCGPGVNNALGLVQLASEQGISVTCGRETPLEGTHVFPEGWRSRVDGLSGLHLPASTQQPSSQDAVDLMTDLISNSSEKITVIALGPLTNLGEALKARPTLAKNIDMLYIMGGAVDVPGNLAFTGIDNAVAEWNIYVDPKAAQLVFDSGVPITLVPLDATDLVPLTVAFYNRLGEAAQTPEADFVYQGLTQNLQFIETEGGYYFWDPLAAAILSDESFVTFDTLELGVVTDEGSRSGQTIRLEGGTSVRVTVGVNSQKFEQVFLDTLNGIAPTGGAASSAEQADLIFFNGSVITIEDSQPVVEAIAIKGEFIQAVGTNEEILALKGPNTKVIDLQGHALMPGFIDGHTHILAFPDRMGRTLQQAQETALFYGFTSLNEMWADESFISRLMQAEQQGNLHLRVNVFASYNDGVLDEDHQKVFIKAWFPGHAPILDPTQRVRIPGIKVFLDGDNWTPARGCWAFSDPFPPTAYSITSGLCGNDHGDLYWQQDELNQVVAQAQAAGYRVAFHAMGDAAIETALNSIEFALNGQSNEIFRHQIEHNSMIRPDLLPRYENLKVLASVRGYGDFCNLKEGTEAFGPDRINWYANRYALPGLDIHAYMETDFGWTTDPNDRFAQRGLDPIMQLYGIVTHKLEGPDGTICNPDPVVANYVISVERALQMLTIDPAYAVSMEDYVGSLKPGKYADLIVLSANPLAVDSDELMNLQVWMTMVAGKVEYCASGKETYCP